MVELRDDLALALDRVAFARSVGLEPDPWQRDLLHSDSPRVILNCSRQAGKSTVSGVLALHTALYRPESLVLCLAPSERQSKELFSKITGFYRVAVAAGEARHAVPAGSDRKLGVELDNGSRIEALPGSERTIRGFSGAALLLVDEASRVDDGLYYAVRPMLAVSGGSLVLLSSPHGKRGVFFEAWANGGASWERYEVPASDCPRIPRAFLEEERKALPSRIYRQEYECSFEETDDQVFGYEVVDRAITSEVAPLFVGAGGGGGW